ncbi:MAG: winged helix-turn-helix domain-containing protein [Lysobacterales bacterium]
MPEPDSLQPTRWRVGDYHFDANTHRLTGEHCDRVLEPKPAALLAYFCQHPGRDIGRDELLESVWHGQIVSDNSISRVIVLLRKALQDDDKARKYIATVPKLGYRFIASVSGVENLPEHNPTEKNPWASSTGFWRTVVIGVVLTALALAVLLGRPQPDPNVDPNRTIVPLSRLALAQSNGHLASDGQQLLYTANDGVWDVIYWVVDSDAEPIPISAPGGHANFAAWSPSNEFIVYQFLRGDICEFHRVDRGQFKSRTAKVIYRCLPDSYSELSVSLDNSTLYFLERPAPHAPYSAFSLDLNRQTKRRLSQPTSQGYGNHYMDVHPLSGALLLLSNHAPGQTSVYELDPVSDGFALRRRFDYGLDSALWSHKPGFIVHPSRHPSYQLLKSSLSDNTSAVVVSDSRRISGPRRIQVPERQLYEYSFTSYLFNRDIEVGSLQTDRLNSAVMDYLPALSHSGNKLAFISKRSGDSQIWVKDLRDAGLTAIAPPDPGRRFYGLAWSENDQLLLANTSTGILVYSFAESTYPHDITLALPAYGVEWVDPQTLSFSHFENNQWQAYEVHLDTGEREPMDLRWAFRMGNAQQTLNFDQNLAVFRGGEELTALRQCARSLWRYQLRLRLDGDTIYCHADDSVNDLLRFDHDMNVTRLPDAVNRFEFFSVRSDVIAKTIVASASSDIMQTRSSE